MDEIRLEKGQHAVMNADHTVTTTAGALDGGPSIPKQAATLNHHHENQVSPLLHPSSGEPTTDQAAAAAAAASTTKPADTQKNKYGTFFKWK